VPIFEYRCPACQRRFETLVQGSTRPACPGCGSKKLDKLLSVFAVGSAAPRESSAAAGGCGTCGDPRGPGACAVGDD